MPRIRGMLKGGDPWHGGIRAEVGVFIDRCECVPLVRELCKKIRRTYARESLQASETALLDVVVKAVRSGDIDFFQEIANRLRAAPSGVDVDPIGSTIISYWNRAKVRSNLHEKSYVRVSFPEVLSWIRESHPGYRFNEKKLREKAKKLGVVFGRPGRPRKTPR